MGRPDSAAVMQLLDRATSTYGFRPVSDQFWADLIHGSRDAIVQAHVASDTGSYVAYAQAAPTGSSTTAWTVETVIADLDDRAPSLLATVLTDVATAIAGRGGSDLTWLVQAPTDHHHAAAAALGFAPTRSIQQLRRPLPTGLPLDIVTRAFTDDDIDQIVRVNARAFAWNPEQGGWTAADVRARIGEPWFDPGGFLILERDDRIAGFCWTKVHRATATEPSLGEIYVIAVDPEFHGQGLGRQLTLAGLQHLSDRGTPVGMLFVDAANTPAVKLYDQLGFVVHRVDVLFEKQIGG